MNSVLLNLTNAFIWTNGDYYGKEFKPGGRELRPARYVGSIALYVYDNYMAPSQWIILAVGISSQHNQSPFKTLLLTHKAPRK